MPKIFENFSGSLPLMILLYMVIFYFFFIRPKSKQKKENLSFFDELMLGDWVITIGGIHGVVRDIHEDYLILSLGSQVRSPQLKIQKEAVAIEMSLQVYPKEKKEEKKS